MTPDRWKSLTSSERVHIRQFQLKRIEQEQLLEEKEALKMTEVRYFFTLFTISCLMILWDVGREANAPVVIFIGEDGIL
jgi:hypothetical protein